jgi:hypothetical protein
VNRALQAKILVLVFWVVGAPLMALSFIALPRVLSPGSLPARAAWAMVPALGVVTVVFCIRTLLRMDARAGGATFDRRWLGRYYVEIFIAFIVYAVLFAVTVNIAPTMRDSRTQLLAGLIPSLGLALIIAAIVRWVRRADDYHRTRLLESFAVTAAVTAFWTSSYSILEIVGYPRLPLYWVPVGMTVTWFAWSVGRALLRR